MVGKKFFCYLPVIPVRADASDTAEIVTQFLFGELGEVLEQKEQWIKVKSEHDDYEGFIDFKQIQVITQEDFQKHLATEKRQVNNLVRYNSPFGPITSLKGAYINENVNSFHIGTYKFERLDQKQSVPNHGSIGDIVMDYLNAPYLWGGRTQFGIDCSGFTQAVFRYFGVELLRDASMQVKQGEATTFEEMQMGDLAFFSNAKGKVTHVGIVLEDNKIIHASGRVKIEELNENGIYSKELKKQTHQLTHLRRYFI